MNTLFNDYEEFLKKFETKKTTDDCYTPPEVYEAVKDYALGLFPDWRHRPIARPFYPGGDYEGLDYGDSVVIDNPPFSIYSKICRFYCKRKVPFFLFAPAKTAIISDLDLTYVMIYDQVLYDNGALVNTSFVSNHTCEYRFLTAPELNEKIREIKQKKQTKKN